MRADRPDLDAGARVTINPSWVLREEDGGEAILFDADTGEVWVANRSTVAVWRLVVGERTVGDLLAELRRGFDGFDQEGSREVVELLGALADAGALRVAS